MPLRFLVVGASGFVGRNILAHVRERGFEAIGTQSLPRDPGLTTFDLLAHRIGDCVPPDFFQRPGRVCVVICAVVSNMDQCLQERARSHRINVVQTRQLIDDVCARGAKPVFLSSCFVFDGIRGYYTEADARAPANEYGRHKVEVEDHLLARVPDALITRLDKIVGDNPADPQLLAHWYQLICAGQPIVCMQGSLLSPTYVGDVAEGLVRACALDLKGVYHLANAEFFYRDELARHFCYALELEPRVVTKPLADFHFADHRALKSFLDGTRFAQATELRFTSMRAVFHAFRRRAMDK